MENRFEELCAELANMDVPYRTASNSNTDGHYAMLIGDGKRGSNCYMVVAYCADLNVFSYYIINNGYHGIKITKSEEEMVARVARFYYEVYAEV